MGHNPADTTSTPVCVLSPAQIDIDSEAQSWSGPIFPEEKPSDPKSGIPIPPPWIAHANFPTSVSVSLCGCTWLCIDDTPRQATVKFLLTHACR